MPYLHKRTKILGFLLILLSGFAAGPAWSQNNCQLDQDIQPRVEVEEFVAFGQLLVFGRDPTAQRTNYFGGWITKVTGRTNGEDYRKSAMQPMPYLFKK